MKSGDSAEGLWGGRSLAQPGRVPHEAPDLSAQFISPQIASHIFSPTRQS